MSFSVRDFSVLHYANGFTGWHYKARDLRDVLQPGFFNPVHDIITVGDCIYASCPEGAAILAVVKPNAAGTVKVIEMRSSMPLAAQPDPAITDLLAAIDALHNRVAALEAALLHLGITALDARDGDCDREPEEDVCDAEDAPLSNLPDVSDNNEHPRAGFLNRRTGAWSGAAADPERVS